VDVIISPIGRWNKGGPGVTNSAGTTSGAVKKGSVSQTRFTKKPGGILESRARTRITPYRTAMAGRLREKLTERIRARITISLTLASMDWKRPGRALISSAKRERSKVSPIPFNVFSKNALLRDRRDKV
jgi:hypothetical protein